MEKQNLTHRSTIQMTALDQLKRKIKAPNVTKNELIDKLNICISKIGDLTNVCSNQAKFIDNLNKKVTELETIISGLSEELKDLKQTKNGNIGDTVSGSGTNHIYSAQTSADLWANFDKQTAVKITKVIKEESRKIEKLENNVVIFGLKDESENSKDTDGLVKNLFKDIDLKINIVKLKRLKSKSENVIAPVIVELQNTRDKFTVLKASKKLRDLSKYKLLYIKPDLTKEEQAEDKALREERDKKNKELKFGSDNKKYGLHKFDSKEKEEKFYYGIRNGYVRRIKINDSPEQSSQ